MPQREYNLQLFLDRLTRRSMLSAKEKSQVLEWPVKVAHARSNEDVVRLGECVDHACYVLDGLLGSFDQNMRGVRQITALHIPGEMPDLHSVVVPRAGSAIQALTPTTMLFVPHAAIRRSARAFPHLAEAFWRSCTVDAMILAQWVVNVGRRDAATRIAHLLCEMACRHSIARGERMVFRLPMTQEQLADATGMTPVHVNRTLRNIATIGTTFRHGTVRIEDWNALSKLGGFNDTYLQLDQVPEHRVLAET